MLVNVPDSGDTGEASGITLLHLSVNSQKEPVMWHRIGLMVVVLFIPAGVRADEAPERLLPADTQVYMRWDGVEAHHIAYQKTALGQMLQGDTGKFVASVFGQFQDLLGGAVVQELLQGTPPEKLQKVQADALAAPKLVRLLAQHGVLVAAEVRGIEPPDGQVMLIVPDAGEQATALFATFRLAAALTKQEIKEHHVAGRVIHQLANGPVPVAWWVEGKHFLLTGGTQPPEAVIKQLHDKGPRLADSPLFQRVTNFKGFETGTRAFLDVAALGKVAAGRNQEVSKLLDEAGLDSVKAVIFYSGFDGAVDRGIMEMDVTGPRKGLLRLLGGKTFRLGDVPLLPPDAASWTMTTFDAALAYDEGLRTARSILRLVAPNVLPTLEAFLKELNEGAGVNLRGDLLGSLGDQLVQYSSGAEGAPFFGQTYLLRAKDPQKLLQALDQAIKGLAKRAGVDVTTKKRTYHGVELREVHVRQQGFFFVPTYAVHKGWLAVSYYPQGVHGYILRSNGDLPPWRPDTPTQASLAKLPQEFTAVAVSDPRPAVRQVLALAPLIGAAVNSSVPGSKFDVGLIPNAHEATRHLFPNVSVVTDDGHTVRLETRASLALPLDLGNTDTLVALELVAVFSFRFVR